ncbi:DUF3243 domain-containing protein [Thalassobacillus sp. B23F22_16]|uniref:DUF3243 domain-containing protein n=1 Tax=Thalassobacillus sp. B23F22_16 TaxID=3459513 RepID=UPI00373F2029
MKDPRDAAANMSEDKKDDIMQNFQNFKDYLGDQVNKGEKLGLGEEGLTKGAKRVGDYLAKNEDPRNREEKLLNELWKFADEDERKHMAHVLVKLADSTN